MKPTRTITPGTKIEGLTPAFVGKAERLDAEIRGEWKDINRSFTRFGKKCLEFKRAGYHTALGYKNFGAWAQDIFGESQSQIFESMRFIKELTEITGPGRVPERDLEEISQQNKRALIKMPAKARTQKVIEAAKELPAHRFQQEIVAPTIGEAESVRLGPWMVDKSIGENFRYALDIMRALCVDDDREVSLTEKALDLMSAEIISSHGAEYERLRKDERLASEAAAQAGSDAMTARP